MQTFHKVRRRQLLLGLAVVLIATLISVWPATADDQRPQVVTALLDSPSVEQVGPTTLRIDISDPRVVALLADTGDHLDGWTFETTGVTVLDSEARRALDATMLDDAGSQNEEPADLCPSVPTGVRQNGATTPYLGCDPVTGSEVLGEAVRGALPDSAARAAHAVMSQSIAVDEKDVTAIERGSGDITISVSHEVGEKLSALAFGDAATVLTHLMFTFHSNGAIDSVTLTVDGDCRAFALSVGGDMCGPLYYPILAN